MLILNEFNKLEVEEHSIMGEEIEYILVEDTPENRKAIDLALATHFSWAIVSLENVNNLTAGGHEVIQKHAEEGFINLAGIIWDELPEETTKAIYWSSKHGFSIDAD